jgi:hypothetical protein
MGTQREHFGNQKVCHHFWHGLISLAKYTLPILLGRLIVFLCSFSLPQSSLATSSLSTYLPITDEIGYLAGFRSISGFFSIGCFFVFLFLGKIFQLVNLFLK